MDQKELPTEAEWELAARGGLDGAAYAWCPDLLPGNCPMANTWQGVLPWQNLLTDGYEGTSPVGAFPPNGYGLFDMIGNVWEWTTDWYEPRHPGEAPKACCVPHNPRAGREEESYDRSNPAIRIPRKVLKGGSHLCAPNYCRRLSAHRAIPRAGGHLHLSRRRSLHRSLDGRVAQPRRAPAVATLPDTTEAHPTWCAGSAAPRPCHH